MYENIFGNKGINLKSNLSILSNTVKRIFDINKGSTLTYIALFELEEDGYSVYIPDLDNVTCGSDLEDAGYMAKDLVRAVLDVSNLIVPTSLEDFKDKYPEIHEKSLKFTNCLVPISIKIKVS